MSWVLLQVSADSSTASPPQGPASAETLGFENFFILGASTPQLSTVRQVAVKYGPFQGMLAR